MTYIFLPATDPGDDTFGRPPVRMTTGAESFQVRFDRQVWFNLEHRRAAMAQMVRGNPPQPWILVGFSKSGLGALNLGIDHPGLFAGIVVFDAPLAMRGPPPWDSGDFYGPAEWNHDLPIHRIAAIQQLLQVTRVRHIAGAAFPEHHRQFHDALGSCPPGYDYVVRTDLAHHWSSGWVEAYC